MPATSRYSHAKAAGLCLFILTAMFAPRLAVGEAKDEKILTGEFLGRLQFRKAVTLAVVYGAQMRAGGYLTVPRGSEVVFRSSSDDPTTGSTKLQIMGMCDLFGSEKEPITVRSLNNGKFIVGDTSKRDNLRPGPVVTHCRIRYSVFINTPLVVRDGNVSLEECVFIGAPVSVDGGTVSLNKCTFVNPTGTGLEIIRADKYPNVVVRSCTFSDSATGLSVKLGIMRDKRAQLFIANCNFARNGSHFYYEELIHFLLNSCWMSEPAATEEPAFSYPTDEQYKGRVVARSMKKSQIRRTGASLVSSGAVKPLELLPKEEETPPEEAADAPAGEGDK